VLQTPQQLFDNPPILLVPLLALHYPRRNPRQPLPLSTLIFIIIIPVLPAARPGCHLTDGHRRLSHLHSLPQRRLDLLLMHSHSPHPTPPISPPYRLHTPVLPLPPIVPAAVQPTSSFSTPRIRHPLLCRPLHSPVPPHLLLPTHADLSYHSFRHSPQLAVQ